MDLNQTRRRFWRIQATLVWNMCPICPTVPEIKLLIVTRGRVAIKKGVSLGATVKLSAWPGHGFESWKQPIILGDRLSTSHSCGCMHGPSPDPANAGCLMHWDAIKLKANINFTWSKKQEEKCLFLWSEEHKIFSNFFVISFMFDSWVTLYNMFEHQTSLNQRAWLHLWSNNPSLGFQYRVLFLSHFSYTSILICHMTWLTFCSLFSHDMSYCCSPNNSFLLSLYWLWFLQKKFLLPSSWYSICMHLFYLA